MGDKNYYTILESETEQVSNAYGEQELQEFFDSNAEQLQDSGEIAVIDFKNKTCKFFTVTIEKNAKIVQLN